MIFAEAKITLRHMDALPPFFLTDTCKLLKMLHFSATALYSPKILQISHLGADILMFLSGLNAPYVSALFPAVEPPLLQQLTLMDLTS